MADILCNRIETPGAWETGEWNGWDPLKGRHSPLKLHPFPARLANPKPTSDPRSLIQPSTAMQQWAYMLLSANLGASRRQEGAS